MKRTNWTTASTLRRRNGLQQPSVLTELVPINATPDIVLARQRGRLISEELGASEVHTTLVATIISELARNIVQFARTGHIALAEARDAGRFGIEITARDQGPGITDLQRALLGGYSTCGRMGLGLCGVKRVADAFDIVSGPSNGTTVTATKWFL